MFRGKWLVVAAASLSPLFGWPTGASGAGIEGDATEDAPTVVRLASEGELVPFGPAESARTARSLLSVSSPGTNTGWRMGGFVVGGPSVDKMLDNKTLDSKFLSAFGYQFQREYGMGETKGLLDVIPLVMGLDQSLFIPSVSVVVGLRFPNGLEVGLGPHWSPRLPELDPFPNDDVHIEGLGLAGHIGYAWNPGDMTVSVNYSFMKAGDLSAHGITFGWKFE
ncbi:MAG: hypothetical protein ACYS9X_27830 [Planctomycetota bacterium]|jgi:hypothetical protein